MSRILTALVAIPLLLGLILIAPAWAFGMFVMVAATLGFSEFSNMASKLNAPTFRAGYGITALLVLCFSALPIWPAGPFLSIDFRLTTALILSVLTLAVTAMRHQTKSSTTASLFATFLGTIYLGVLFGTLYGIRNLGLDGDGRRWVLFTFLIIMMSDTGAYYAGRAFGRHPLAPKLSPKKTIEGLVGGLIASVIAAWGFHRYLENGLSVGTPGLAELLLLAAVLAIAGVCGDLFESTLKRTAGVKDSSNLLPGHGGILDRFDSILFAAPLLWLYLRATHP